MAIPPFKSAWYEFPRKGADGILRRVHCNADNIYSLFWVGNPHPAYDAGAIFMEELV